MVSNRAAAMERVRRREGVCGSEWGEGEGCVGGEKRRDVTDGGLLLNWEKTGGGKTVETTGSIICFSSGDLSNNVEFILVELHNTHCRIL